MLTEKLSLPRALKLTAILAAAGLCTPAHAAILQDTAHKTVTLTDGVGDLTLRLNYDNQCLLDQVTVRGRQVIAPEGVVSGVRIGNGWFSTRLGIPTPKVVAGKGKLTVSGITFGAPGQPIEETWTFQVLPDRINWHITRNYPSEMQLDDTGFPNWSFQSLSTWTGGMLSDGGVVWNKYLDTPGATYGAHTDTVTFWNREKNDALRITPTLGAGLQSAVRFSRLPMTGGDRFVFNASVSSEPLKPKHNLNRFLGDRMDLWSPFTVKPGQADVEFSLQSFDYAKTYSRGTLKGIDESSVRELLNTVGRYGVIDEKHIGTNGWRSGYICLHEQWLAQIGMAVDDPNYTSNFGDTLNYWRDNAVKPDGRVLSRWKYDAGDATRGTYTDKGFYEAQWGTLLDSQTDYVINVAEQFDQSGDAKWLAGQKETCEKVLGYLLGREVAGSGIVAMLPDSRLERRSSDWFDIVWASHQNALVNAELYHALNLWADAEETLGDVKRAGDYRAFAARLKATYNKPIVEGGFWDPANKWYVYWRDKDGSVHGNNLFTAVNFTAIAYSICDDKERQKAVLDRIEVEMQKEDLFHWPTNFISFQPDEAANKYPDYENGDIFMGWGEMGVRAYAAYDPAIAVKYVEKVLAKYEQDGLSFQRYLRKSQTGAGDDILANNCLAIVGLYTDIYGIRPKPNRLYLEPHLTPELNGTQLPYLLRGTKYIIDLSTVGSSISVGNLKVRDASPFAVNATATELQYFPGTSKTWGMSLTQPKSGAVTVQVENWPESPVAPRSWLETSSGKGGSGHVVAGLRPGAVYGLKVDGKVSASLKADKDGSVRFNSKGAGSQAYELAWLRQ